VTADATGRPQLKAFVSEQRPISEHSTPPVYSITIFHLFLLYPI